MKNFQYQFGGSEKDVRDSQRYFLPFFKNCQPVLDLGCGRGVFLEMLRENGVDAAIGIDNSDEAMAYCKNKGLEVYQEDTLSFLQKNKNKFAGIFCSHLIEHLSYDQALELIAYCHQTLKKDGVLIIVTPNIASFRVVSQIFWLDQTHVRPYPQALLLGMLQRTGFSIMESKSLDLHRDWKSRCCWFWESVLNMGRTGINLYAIAKK